ncbi:MAG TPA: hypothetical protein HA362_02290 [Nanoarchaeota archaeon]|nr:hypothetical protein [Nanoarchaeota archaeon]
MPVPDTFFRYFSEGPCVIVYPAVYQACNGYGGAYMDFFGCRIGLVQKTTIPMLEQDYLAKSGMHSGLLSAIRTKAESGTQSPHLQPALLVITQLSGAVGGGAIAEHVLPKKELLFLNSMVYPLFESSRGDIFVRGRNFNLGLSHIAAVSDIEADYKKKIRKRAAGSPLRMALDSIAEGIFYDNEKQVGFRIMDSRFYVFTKIQPYILYERKNGAYYSFGEAEVGAPVFMNADSVDFGKLYVLNPYSHPSLPAAGKPLQCICTGRYDYGSIKRLHPDNPKLQLEALMEKARAVLTEEYRSNAKPYAFLTDSRFERQRITGAPGISRVTNVN